MKVRDDGTVKVLDFGLAKALAADPTGGSMEGMNSPTLTARATQLVVMNWIEELKAKVGGK